MPKEGNKIQWFKFCPLEWMDILLLNNEDAGARFKEVILRLGKNEAPEDTIEGRMIEESREYSRIKREAVAARWNRKAPVNRPSPVPPSPPAPQANRPKKMKPPTLPEVYDFCQAYKLPDTFGREWLEWQESKGWNTLRVHWHAALTAFCKKKLKEEKQ